ncbi:MAG: acetyl-CoA carboxylase biotin carboxyl carrier protein [Flavobacteriales bacterium]|nr:acetyl-CoA carboxylase biotin carboxyl carrier protein [Flavobacteriales bacterium]MBT5698383.1 acetyl-CoA carboxylase biotin carboxyl carrier protein [Flavobacteriales bacterium]MBT6815650.1 acetyl-CoA carboxylase biotin carboxyl carrier protein [Flavobacteriales bacterium]MBT7726422.1 acetyl-CoA carboxylase biotin carboxyl carrier protein [Flavobacteriales bacterium]
MNLEDIQELIKFVAKSGATEVDLEIDNIKISIKSPAKKRRGEVDVPTIIHQAPAQIVTQAPVSVPADTPPIETAPEKKVGNEEDNSNYVAIKSSMIGTFYRSSSPENPSFVNVGDTIKEGDTICIIEAMKLFNEIESEVSGTIIKVLVDDATPIEFDQPLFLVDPS